MPLNFVCLMEWFLSQEEISLNNSMFVEGNVWEMSDCFFFLIPLDTLTRNPYDLFLVYKNTSARLLDKREKVKIRRYDSSSDSFRIE